MALKHSTAAATRRARKRPVVVLPSGKAPHGAPGVRRPVLDDWTRHFYVALGHGVVEDGKKLLNMPLSKSFTSERTARRALARIRREHPDARLMEISTEPYVRECRPPEFVMVPLLRTSDEIDSWLRSATTQQAES